MKRLFKIIIPLLCILMLIPSAFAVQQRSTYTGTCGDDLTWNLNTVSGVLIISGTGVMEDYSANELAPWFEHRSDITHVSIDSQVRTIGDYAFYYCTNLTTFTGGSGLNEIGSFAFARSGIQLFTAYSNLRLIKEKAFSYCRDLTYVDTGDVFVIEESAFEHCDTLESVSFGSSLVEIGDYAFNCCEALESIEFSSESVTIGDYSFTRCGIKSCDLTGVTTIGKGAFYHCTSLNELTIPATVTEICDRAFVSCDNLSHISFEGAAPVVTEATSNDRSFDADITLGYRNGANGWTSPIWNGYSSIISVISGDINGDGKVSNSDLVRLARHLIDILTLNDDQLIAADMNGNGTVTNADLVFLARALLN